MEEKSSKDIGERKNQERRRRLFRLLCVILFIVSAAGLAGYGVLCFYQDKTTRDVQEALQNILEAEEAAASKEGEPENGFGTETSVPKIKPQKPEILWKYGSLYEINPDMIGWLAIDGTVIDYPVMQTMEDESYYLSVDFYGQPNKNGCLIMDTDSVVGTGTKADGYMDGASPSTNLIIHGHTMRNGDMFGDLSLYADETYGKEHSRICFDSLYEEREYELIAAFYSQVYYESEDVFKYYKFFQADTQEEFDDWYDHIKELSLYDTGVTAEFGDEFITLSCCAYHVEDGRFVVVAKRIK